MSATGFTSAGSKQEARAKHSSGKKDGNGCYTNQATFWRIVEREELQATGLAAGTLYYWRTSAGTRILRSRTTNVPAILSCQPCLRTSSPVQKNPSPKGNSDMK